MSAREKQFIWLPFTPARRMHLDDWESSRRGRRRIFVVLPDLVCAGSGLKTESAVWTRARRRRAGKRLKRRFLGPQFGEAQAGTGIGFSYAGCRFRKEERRMSAGRGFVREAKRE